MQKIFLTYMNQSECPSYSLVGTVNDEFHDIDASQKFFDIPLYTDPDSEDIVLNSINFEVKTDMHDDKFCAIPVYFWRPWTKSYNNHKHKRNRIKLYQPTVNTNFFTDLSLKWLGPTSSISCDVNLSHHQETLAGQCVYFGNIQRETLAINNQASLNCTKLVSYRENYIPNSWFVCYRASTRPHYYDTHISIRTHKNLFVSPIQSQSRYNYIVIGEKSIAMDRVIFYKKVNTIWDYLNCLKLCETVSGTSFYY